jgi:hypothetical protein
MLPRARLHDAPGALAAKASHVAREGARRARPLLVIGRGVLIGMLIAAIAAFAIERTFATAEAPEMRVMKIEELEKLEVVDRKTDDGRVLRSLQRTNNAE